MVTAEAFPHGLRCAMCSSEMVEGELIGERLDGMSALGNGEPAVWVTLICAECSGV